VWFQHPNRSQLRPPGNEKRRLTFTVRAASKSADVSGFVGLQNLVVLVRVLLVLAQVLAVLLRVLLVLDQILDFLLLGSLVGLQAGAVGLHRFGVPGLLVGGELGLVGLDLRLLLVDGGGVLLHVGLVGAKVLAVFLDFLAVLVQVLLVLLDLRAVHGGGGSGRGLGIDGTESGEGDGGGESSGVHEDLLWMSPVIGFCINGDQGSCQSPSTSA